MRKSPRKAAASSDSEPENAEGFHKLDAHIHRRGRKEDSSAMTGLTAGLVIAAIIFFVWRALAG